MKYIFYLNKKIQGAKPVKDIFEYDEKTDYEDIENDFEVWLHEQIDAGFSEIEEDEEE